MEDRLLSALQQKTSSIFPGTDQGLGMAGEWAGRDPRMCSVDLNGSVVDSLALTGKKWHRPTRKSARDSAGGVARSLPGLLQLCLSPARHGLL